MREQQIQGYINGIRDEFILEAEPKALAALLPETDPVAGTVILSSPAEGSRRKTRGKAKRWIPLIVAAAVTLTVGLNLGLYAGMNALLGQGGALLPSTPSGGNPLGGLLGGLFPFLSPDETEPPYEVTVRDPDSPDEPDGPDDPTPPETETPHPCADGHAFTETELRPVSCYAVSRGLRVCADCELEEDVFGEETLPHTFVEGFCTECGLLEGVTGAYNFALSQWNDEQVGSILNVEGPLPDGTLVLPNVCFIEDVGLLPVRIVDTSVQAQKPHRVIIPEGICVVSQLLWGCDTVTEVSLPSTLEVIGYKAFMDCTSLTSLDIPEGVTAIRYFAFSGCTLPSLRLPDSVAEIDESAFENCTALEVTSLPASLTEIGKRAFAGCAKVNFAALPEGVTAVGEEAFLNCVSLTGIYLPDGCTEVGRAAFKDCTALTSVRLPGDMTVLNDSTFSGCTALTEVILPETLTYIGSGAFQKTAILSLRIPASVEEVESNAFADNTALTEVVFEGDTTKLNTFLFYNCTALERVVLPDRLTKLPTWFFRNCTSLREVVLPSSLTVMGTQLFENCPSLRTLFIPDSVKELQSFAQDCEGLESVTLPASLEKVDGLLFHECPNLRELILSESNTAFKVVDGCLIRVADKTLVKATVNAVIPSDGSVTAIDAGAFQGRNITTVTIPGTVRTVSVGSFHSCALLEEITLSEGVVSIGQNAFYGCAKLERLYLPSTISSLSQDTFQNCPALTEIYAEVSIKKWETMTHSMELSDVPFTVYCKDGMIEPGGAVTRY